MTTTCSIMLPHQCFARRRHHEQGSHANYFFHVPADNYLFQTVDGPRARAAAAAAPPGRRARLLVPREGERLPARLQAGPELR